MSPFSIFVRSSFVLCLLFVSTFQYGDEHNEHGNDHEDQQESDDDNISKADKFSRSRTPWEVTTHRQLNDPSSSEGLDQSYSPADQSNEFETAHIAHVLKKSKKKKKEKKHKEPKKKKEHKKNKKDKHKLKNKKNNNVIQLHLQQPQQQQPQPVLRQPRQQEPQPVTRQRQQQLQLQELQPVQQQQQQPQPEEQQQQQQKVPQQPALPPGQFVEMNFPGAWEVVQDDAGISAMHLQLLPNNKLIMFDATSLGKSNIELPPNNCRIDPNINLPDCFAHSVEFDSLTNNVRVLKVTTDPWCSSGGLAPDGTLIGTGGWKDGGHTIRYMPACEGCDWRESGIKLLEERWYGTQVMLGDGRFVVFGGRRGFSYEFIAPENLPAPPKVDLPFLRDTTDIYENNLYPFVHLLPNGNIFIFANTKAIQLDVRTNTIVKNYPDLPGGARNYPGSGSATFLPIDLRKFPDQNLVDVEILICGGGEPLAFGKAEKENIFLPALDTCGKIKALDPAGQWEMDKMTSARVMGDMLNLPNGQILMLNGARKGASGWLFADDPNLVPLLYDPNKPLGQRFRDLAPTTIPRMYHSTSALLPDGKILVSGSNTNPNYQFVNVKFPTELRVEKFSPPYMGAQLDNIRPELLLGSVTKQVKYNWEILLEFNVKGQQVQQQDVMVSIYQPPFTTHGYSQNQRLVILPVVTFESTPTGQCKVKVTAPAKGELAPPCYYILFVSHKGVPSKGAWIQLQL